MGGLCVVDQAIGSDDTEVALRHQRADQFPSSQLLHEPFRIVANRLCDLFERPLIDTRQDPFDSGGIADQNNGAA